MALSLFDVIVYCNSEGKLFISTAKQPKEISLQEPWVKAHDNLPFYSYIGKRNEVKKWEEDEVFPFLSIHQVQVLLDSFGNIHTLESKEAVKLCAK